MICKTTLQASGKSVCGRAAGFKGVFARFVRAGSGAFDLKGITEQTLKAHKRLNDGADARQVSQYQADRPQAAERSAFCHQQTELLAAGLPRSFFYGSVRFIVPGHSPLISLGR
jgi:hypothetical protein